jgi:hypothetical protein
MPPALKVSANESSPVTDAGYYRSQSRRSLKAIVRCAVIDLPSGFASVDVSGAESVKFPAFCQLLAREKLNYFADAFQLAEVRETTFRSARFVGKR